MFKLITNELEVKDIQEYLSSPKAGALNCFEGRVRDHHLGRKVVALEYEAQEELCQSEADKIIEEAKERYGVINAVCIHRVGRLHVGEMVVWVGVIASRRDEAFRACRYIIDELKTRLPIWKKEFYEDGDSGWVNCEKGYQERINQPDFYSRQILLEDIGPAGQQKLFDARVLVVGAGGLGSSVLQALAGSGVGTLGICEFDLLEESNLHRQYLYSHEDLGKPKASLAADRINEYNPSIKVRVHARKLDESNAENIIQDYDIVVDCTDNFPAKYLLNDACYLYNKPLVQASIYQFDGQLQTLIPKTAGCLRCQWPVMPKPESVQTCAQAGVMGTVPVILGQMQAIEVIKIICGLEGSLDDKMMTVNLRNYEQNLINRPKDPSCPLCGEHPVITEIRKSLYIT